MKTTSKYLSILVLLTVIPSTALSRIYKCKADGETIFSDIPCSQEVVENVPRTKSSNKDAAISANVNTIINGQESKRLDESTQKIDSKNP